MSPRTCSHIRPNGTKCGSPTLKYNTLCYFHYQWQNRRQVGYRGTPGHWTTLRLPLLESKASILFAISEIQHALLSAAIDVKTAKTLMYGIQLALQLKISDEEISAPTQAPDSCDELHQEMQEEREHHKRPPQAVCDTCEKADACRSHSDCHHSTEQIREFESIHEPDRYAKDRAIEEEGKRRWDEATANLKGFPLSTTTNPNPTTTTPNDLSSRAVSPRDTSQLHAPLDPCHPERSATPSREVAGPFVSSTTQPASTSTPNQIEATAQPQESSPARCGVSDEKDLPSRATARRHKLFANPEAFDRLKHRALNEINTLIPNS